MAHLAKAIKQTESKVENGTSPTLDRVDYQPDADGNGRIYIVIGGNVLSRGLTLEGLTVSFFIRSASAYDTLLQMGRWFGYRPGYADLARELGSLAARTAPLSALEKRLFNLNRLLP